MVHPYTTLPDRSYWSRAVSHWDPRTLVGPITLLRSDDKVVSAGSCFAVNIIQYIESWGYHYVRAAGISELAGGSFGYGSYSADYGNVYTARQMLQLVRRSLGHFQPLEDRWYMGDAVIDPFRPGLDYPATDDEEFDLLTAAYLSRVREVFKTASVFIFTLGLTEAWVSAHDGAVFPACPGTVAGEYDPTRHLFKNFTVEEVVEDLKALTAELRSINPSIRIILSVSPVPLVATATGNHVLLASVESKSVLRASCGYITRDDADIIYFPAYEIITGPQSPDYFEKDKRNISKKGIEAVMEVFEKNSEKSSNDDRIEGRNRNTAQLSGVLNSECEEMLSDPSLRRDK